MLASFLRMIYSEKIVVTPAVDVQLSKIDNEMKSLLFEACCQLERKGPFLTRMMVSKIKYRKY